MYKQIKQFKRLLEETAKWKEKDVEWKKKNDINKINSIFEEAKKNKDVLFIRFSNIDKININPTYRYQTPLGTYAYFIDFSDSRDLRNITGEKLLECFLSKDERTFEAWFSTTFGFNYKYMHIFVMKNSNIASTGRFATYKEFLSILDNIEEVYKKYYRKGEENFYEILSSSPHGERGYYRSLRDVYNLKLEGSSTTKVSYRLIYTFILSFSYRISSESKGARVSNRFYRALNMDAIIDYDSTIHPSEPEQAVIISTNKQELLATFERYSVESIDDLKMRFDWIVSNNFSDAEQVFEFFKSFKNNLNILSYIFSDYMTLHNIANLFYFINEHYDSKLMKNLLYKIANFILNTHHLNVFSFDIRSFEEVAGILTNVDEKTRLKIYIKLVMFFLHNPAFQRRFWESSYVKNNIKETIDIISTAYPKIKIYIPLPILNYYTVQESLSNPCLSYNFLNDFTNYDISTYNKILSNITEALPIEETNIDSIYNIVYYLQKSDESFLKKEIMLRCLKQFLHPDLFGKYFKKSIYRLDPNERKDYIMILKSSGAGSTLSPRVHDHKQTNIYTYILSIIKNFYNFANVPEIMKAYLEIKKEYPVKISQDDELLLIEISAEKIEEKILTMFKNVKSVFSYKLYEYSYEGSNFFIRDTYGDVDIEFTGHHNGYDSIQLEKLLNIYKDDPSHQFLAANELYKVLFAAKIFKDQLENYYKIVVKSPEDNYNSVFIHHPWEISGDLFDVIDEFVEQKQKKYTDVFFYIYKRYLRVSVNITNKSQTEIIEICNTIKEIYEFVKNQFSLKKSPQESYEES